MSAQSAFSGQAERIRRSAAEGNTTDASVVGRVVVSVLVLVLGTAALRSAWLDPAAWVPLLGASLAGFAAVWFLRHTGTNPAITTLGALTVPLVLLAVFGRGEGQSRWEGVTNAFPTLLTSPYPAALTPQLLVPGVALAWAGGAIAGAGMTRRSFLVNPLLAGSVLLIAAELMTAGGSDRYGLIGLGLVTVLLVHWSSWPALQSERSRRLSKGPLRQAQGTGSGSGSMFRALAVGVFVMVVGLVPLGQPFQPRELIKPPAVSVAEPNPLPLLGHWARSPDEEILRRTGDDYPVHLVVLPDYNGVSFHSQSEYGPLGRTDAPALPPGRFQTTVETAITWRTTSRWLPAPGVPIEVSITDALIDVDTGSLLSPQTPDGRVVSYTVRGQVDAPRLAEVAAADVGRHPRYTALPAIPPEFAGYAREVTQDADSYLQQAQALERAVKGGRAFDPSATGGSSYGRLHQFLFEPVERGGRRGTSEQFASAYAVLARSVGLPTRVVVGFGGGTPLPEDPQTNIVRGRDALAWPEVYFQGFGWVPFNPTPDLRDLDAPVDRRADAAKASPTSTHQPALPAEPPPSATPMAGWWWLAPVGMLIALAGPTIGLAVARRSRSAGHRERGAIGAWLQVEDALVLAGQATAVTQPAPERAACLGIDEARQVAIAAENAAFAPASAENATARSDWAAARRAERALRADSSWWRRWLWPINPAVWFRCPRR